MILEVPPIFFGGTILKQGTLFTTKYRTVYTTHTTYGYI